MFGANKKNTQSIRRSLKPAANGKNEIVVRAQPPLLDEGSEITVDMKYFIKEQLELKQKEDQRVEKRSIENTEQNIVQVMGIPKDWNEGKVLAYFDPKLEKVESVKPILNKLGAPTGRSILVLKNRRLANEFIQKYNNDFIELKEESHALSVRMFELSTSAKTFKVEKLNRTVMIYDVPFEATNKELADFAGQFGQVKSLYMPMQSSHRNKGYCIVEYPEYAMAQRCVVEGEGLSMFGRQLKFKTGDYLFAGRKKQAPGQSKGFKSNRVIEKAETSEIRIKDYLNSLADELLRSQSAGERSASADSARRPKAETQVSDAEL